MRSVRSTGKIKLASYVRPMLATLHDAPFDDREWIFELKWDGYRAIAEIDDGKVKLYSRNGLSFLPLYPSLATELSKLKLNAVLDGEIVVLDEHNRPSFQKLQQFGDSRSGKLVYYVFDCLAIDGDSMVKLPLAKRKEILKKKLPKNNMVRFSDHVVEHGIQLFTNARKMDLEGIIAKRADSTYIEGKRSKDWLKVKNHNTQEAIIVGYTEPRGARNHFGALLLAIYKKGKLTYIGHTGTGFTEKLLKEIFLKLQPLKRTTSPFEGKIPVNGKVTWVDPQLVCAIKFTEVTNDGILRHPVFQGLRIDKHPKQVSTLEAVQRK
jgi:bifunctional non-homologous end joining protein LigD